MSDRTYYCSLLHSILNLMFVSVKFDVVYRYVQLLGKESAQLPLIGLYKCKSTLISKDSSSFDKKTTCYEFVFFIRYTFLTQPFFHLSKLGTDKKIMFLHVSGSNHLINRAHTKSYI